ncbi:hypothetical protein AB0H42_04265 [Nocardia sp. NPDC050799]
MSVGDERDTDVVDVEGDAGGSVEGARQISEQQARYGVGASYAS